MSDRDDFLDEYIEYKIFEDSMKKSTPKPQKPSGCGCGIWALIIVVILILAGLLGSCAKAERTDRLKAYTKSLSASYSRAYSIGSFDIEEADAPLSYPNSLCCISVGKGSVVSPLGTFYDDKTIDHNRIRCYDGYITIKN